MLSVEIPCSRDKITLQLPATAAQKTRLVQTRKASAAILSSADIARSLEQPLGCAPLRELARGKQSACVVISDITRPVPNPLLLPPLLSSLEQAGIPRDAITILIATGMHRPNLGSELEELVGGETAANYRIINHDCHARDNLRQVAVIDGAPIEVNRHYLDAEFKILTGLIEPHPFAGFSGGGKSILPGLASFETMKFMHSFALVDHPDVATARIADNPFRHHINTVSAAAGVDFIANVLIDDAKQPVAIFSGDPQSAFTAGCRQAESNAVVHVGTPRRSGHHQRRRFPSRRHPLSVEQRADRSREYRPPGRHHFDDCRLQRRARQPQLLRHHPFGQGLAGAISHPLQSS